MRNVEAAGFVPKRRNMHYDVLGDPIFREGAVPRMLSLATARANGTAGEAADVVSRYPARSQEGKEATRRSIESVNPSQSPQCRCRPGCCPFRSRLFAMPGCGQTTAESRVRPHAPGDFTASDERDLGNVAVLPCFVNAHTHLELSWMRGRIPETDDFNGWIRDHRAEESRPPGMARRSPPRLTKDT